MSSEALAWAFRQTCKSSSAKFTLVALCECANYQTGRITPSIAHLAEITGQNRKTIISNIDELVADGFIVDTGERVGRTGQIKVYQACTETVPKVEQSQKRNSTVSGRKQSQKRDTEPSLEPSTLELSNDNSPPPCENLTVSEVVDAWNAMAQRNGLQRVLKITPERRQVAKARIREFTFDDFTEAILAVERSPFLRGEGRTHWKATFDFFIKKSNFVKILEGNYEQAA